MTGVLAPLTKHGGERGLHGKPDFEQACGAKSTGFLIGCRPQICHCRYGSQASGAVLRVGNNG
jgi:hypothetical protein